MGERACMKAYCSGVGVREGRGWEEEKEKGRASSLKFLEDNDDTVGGGVGKVSKGERRG